MKLNSFGKILKIHRIIFSHCRKEKWFHGVLQIPEGEKFYRFFVFRIKQEIQIFGNYTNAPAKTDFLHDL
jgi:hypothetical protein